MTHKTKPFDKLIAEAKTPSSFNKQITSVKLEGEKAAELNLSSMQPTDKQLEQINKFTKSEKTAEDVCVLPTLACNDMIDRDNDQFSEKTIKSFVSMEPPYSPIGKSFLVGHDHTSLPIGRIFDAEAEKISGVNFLKLYSYIPNTEANKSYIENVDFGVYWAVSVGVTLGSAACKVGKDHEWSWHPRFCSAGHEKGLYYDPDSDEKDDWGYPVACEDTSKGVMCYRQLNDPQDFYELSQVYLGAQYFAELTSKSPFDGIKKAALFSPKVPIIGLTAKEAEELPAFKQDAVLQNEIKKNPEMTFSFEDKTFNWVDTSGTTWLYDTNTHKLMSKGKPIESSPILEDASKWTISTWQPNSTSTTGITSPVTETKDNFMNEEEIKAAQEAGVEDSVIEEAKKSDKPALFLFQMVDKLKKDLNASEAKFKAIEPKVTMAEKYIEQLKSDAVAWYVKNHQAGEDKAVDVTLFQKILAACGEDIDLIKELIKEQEESAKAKFPAAVRRSSAQEDIHHREEIKEITPEISSKIKKLHG